MKFNIVNEKSEFKLGNILSIFKLPNSDKKIALFTIRAFDKGEDSLNVAYINRDDDGYDNLEEIKDKAVFEDAMAVAKDMIGIVEEK